MVNASKMNARDVRADKSRNKMLRNLFQHLFSKKFPKGWEIYWNVQGFCSFNDQAIYLSCGSMRDSFDFNTVIHELLHLAEPELKHGKEFWKLLRLKTKEAKRALQVKEVKR